MIYKHEKGKVIKHVLNYQYVIKEAVCPLAWGVLTGSLEQQENCQENKIYIYGFVPLVILFQTARPPWVLEITRDIQVQLEIPRHKLDFLASFRPFSPVRQMP